MNVKPLRVVIGCDTDPDRFDFGGISYNAGRRRQVWNGIACIQTLRERLDEITDSNGRSVAITWLLRCDEQINVTEGAYAYLLKAHAKLWERCEASGDEIGWHPHFWRLEKDQNTWFQEIQDENFQKHMLEEGFRAFTEARGKPPLSVRMGWDYHNNVTMAKLSDLGIRIDFSALPYQKFIGAKNDRGASFAGYYDWSRTGTAPYFPAMNDFQRPGAGQQKLAILELPNGLLRSKFVGILSETRGALRDRSAARFLRAMLPGRAVVNVSIKACSPTFLFRAMVNDILSRQEEWVVTYFHPDELLPDKGQYINNRIHRLDYFVKNIHTLLRLAARAGREVQFLTAAEAADLLA